MSRGWFGLPHIYDAEFKDIDLWKIHIGRDGLCIETTLIKHAIITLKIMIAMVAKLCYYDFEDYDLQKMKYNYVESEIECSNDRARQHRSSMAAYLIILIYIYIFADVRKWRSLTNHRTEFGTRVSHNIRDEKCSLNDSVAGEVSEELLKVVLRNKDPEVFKIRNEILFHDFIETSESIRKSKTRFNFKIALIFHITRIENPERSLISWFLRDSACVYNSKSFRKTRTRFNFLIWN